MATTPTDRIFEVVQIVSELGARADIYEKRVDKLSDSHTNDNKILGDACTGFDKKLSHIMRDIEGLASQIKALEDNKAKQEKEQEDEKKERKRRLWAFGPNVTAALIAVVLGPVSAALLPLIIAWFKGTPPAP